ncbi:MAG: short-chain dehydrogenase/reductase [Sphingomonas bacterium]|nr:short-chain dehydrogenase/reductase [Sphingomonas bacterium]
MTVLNGQRILIVGGSSGIGLATAIAAVAAGADVVIAGRSVDRLRQAIDRTGSGATMALDIADEDATRSTLAMAGRFEHVVVTAGSVSPGPVRGGGTAKAAAGFEAKFWGAYRVAAFADIAERGSLTLVSGVFAQRPMKGNVAASCVNAAVEALARGLALELAPTRVNAVSPGLVDTPLWSGMAAERRAAYFAATAEKLPSRHIGQPEDIAALIFACMTNPVLTGSVLVADGGHLLI